MHGIDEVLVGFLGARNFANDLCWGANEDLELVRQLSGGSVDLTIGSALTFWRNGVCYGLLINTRESQTSKGWQSLIAATSGLVF